MHGNSRQITNDPNDASRTIFSTLTLGTVEAPANRYQHVAFTIRRDNQLYLKKAADLDYDDYIIALFFNGKDVTPWNETLFVERNNAEAESAIDIALTKNLYRIFKKVGCVGDSWTAGYLQTSQGVYGSRPIYSWVEYMKNFDNDWINGGYSGASANTYLSGTTPSNGPGYAAIQAAGRCQAYTVALGINDSNTDLETHIPVGSSSDIGTNNNTFYGWYSKIIDTLRTINNKAFVFCFTMYPGLNNGTTDLTSRYEPYNEAIRTIVAYYQDSQGYATDRVRLVDLEHRDDLFAIYGRGYDLNGNHKGCVGWEMLAEQLKIALGDEIRQHPDIFHDIVTIPYD